MAGALSPIFMKSNLCDKSENNGHLDTGQLRLQLSWQFLMWVFKFTVKVRVYYTYVEIEYKYCRIKAAPATRVSQRKLYWNPRKPEAQGTRKVVISIRSTCQPEASEAPVSHKSHEYLSALSIRSTCQPEASVVTAIQKHNESCQPEVSGFRSTCQPEASGVPVSEEHQQSL